MSQNAPLASSNYNFLAHWTRCSTQSSRWLLIWVSTNRKKWAKCACNHQICWVNVIFNVHIKWFCNNNLLISSASEKMCAIEWMFFFGLKLKQSSAKLFDLSFHARCCRHQQKKDTTKNLKSCRIFNFTIFTSSSISVMLISDRCSLLSFTEII